MLYKKYMNDEIYTGYFRGDSKMNGESAEAYCNSFGSNLATITTAAELADAQNVCGYTASSCWIGLYADDNRDWHWRDGSTDLGFGFDDNGDAIEGVGDPPVDGFWADEEPNDQGNEDCAELRDVVNYYVNDEHCSGSRYPLCNNG